MRHSFGLGASRTLPLADLVTRDHTPRRTVETPYYVESATPHTVTTRLGVAHGPGYVPPGLEPTTPRPAPEHRAITDGNGKILSEVPYLG